MYYSCKGVRCGRLGEILSTAALSTGAFFWCTVRSVSLCAKGIFMFCCGLYICGCDASRKILLYGIRVHT